MAAPGFYIRSMVVVLILGRKHSKVKQKLCLPAWDALTAAGGARYHSREDPGAPRGRKRNKEESDR